MASEERDPRGVVAWIVEHYHTQGGGPYIELWRHGRKASAESQVESMREANPSDTVTMRPLGYLDDAEPVEEPRPTFAGMRVVTNEAIPLGQVLVTDGRTGAKMKETDQ